MAFEQTLNGRYGNHGCAFPGFELSSSPSRSPMSLPIHRRDSMLSSNSFIGSDSSSITAGPLTPLSNHTYHGALVEGLATDTTPSSMPFSDVSALMGINPLETMAQEDVDMTFDEHLTNKISQPWDTNLLSIGSDVNMEIELHHDSGAFDRLPIMSTPPSTNNFVSGANFDPSTPSTSSSSSIFGFSTSSATTVSPNEVYPLTPSSPILGAAFTTPVKRERRSIRSSEIPFYSISQTVGGDENIEDIWSITAVEGASEHIQYPHGRFVIPPGEKDLPFTPEPAVPTPTKRTTRTRKPRVSLPYHNKKITPSSHTVPAPQYHCSILGCDKRFQRKEHCTRHEQTVWHKGSVGQGKPVPEPRQLWCRFCLEAPKKHKEPTVFTRHDNLKQHVKQTHFTQSSKGRAARLVDKKGNYDFELIERYDFGPIWQEFMANKGKKGKKGKKNNDLDVVTDRDEASDTIYSNASGGGRSSKGGLRKKTGRGGLNCSFIVNGKGC